MRFLAVDYGLARTGLAISDPEGRLAFPLLTLRLSDFPRRGDLLDDLARRARDAGAEALVMGLPLCEDGSSSISTAQARNALARLKRRLSLPFFWMPELLSSEEAKADLAQCGLYGTRAKAVLDQQAAVRILETFLALEPHRRTPA